MESMICANSCCAFASSHRVLSSSSRLWSGRPKRRDYYTRIFFSASAATNQEKEKESDCNEEECAPDKEVGKVSKEWVVGDNTKVVGTFPPKKKGWTGYVEKDTAGQTNIYSVEPAIYVAESAISSGNAGSSPDGAENTAAIAAGLALIAVATASSILLQVGKNEPKMQTTEYSGPPLSYYVSKFQPVTTNEAPPVQEPEEAPSAEPAENSLSTDATTPEVQVEVSE